MQNINTSNFHRFAFIYIYFFIYSKTVVIMTLKELLIKIFLNGTHKSYSPIIDSNKLKHYSKINKFISSIHFEMMKLKFNF